MEDIDAILRKVGTKDADMTTDVIYHAGTNNLPRESCQSLANKISRSLHTLQRKYDKAQIYYSPVIPKYNNENIKICDDVNNVMKKVCEKHGYIYVNTRPLFINNIGIRFDRLARDKLHFNKSGVIAIAKHLKFAVLNKVPPSPPPYSP